MLTIALAAVLTASAWLAVQTGEHDKESVERLVPEAPLEDHEEQAEWFVLLSAGVLLISGAGLLRGRVGTAARLATTIGALGLVLAVTGVGHSGGELVYRDGAAAARMPGSPGAGETGRQIDLGRAERESPDD